LFVRIRTTGFRSSFCRPCHSPRGWTDGLRWPETSPARPAWTTRSGPAKIQRGGASRYDSVGGSLQKNACPRTALIPRASERAHGAAERCGPHRSSPWSYGCGEEEGKRSNRCTLARLGLVYFLFKMRYLLHGLLPTPHSVRPHHHHTRPTQPLHPAALAFVPYGVVLVRVRVHTPSFSLLASAGAS